VLLLPEGASVVVAIVGATVAGAGRCWCCCYPRELALVLEGACVLHSCQPTKWRSLNRFQRLSLPFSLCLSLFRSRSCRVKKIKIKIKTKTLQRSIGQGCSALSAIATNYSVVGPTSRVAALLAIAASCSVVGHRREMQRCQPSAASCSVAGHCHSSEL